MRTTLNLDDDALEGIRTFAQNHGISPGEAAASELIRRGCRYQIPIKRVNGFPFFDPPADFTVITDEMVKQILTDEE